MATTLDVTDIATSEDLANEIGGNAALDNLGGIGVVQAALCAGLDDVVDDLRNRVPPVRESALADITELRLATMYGALERLYRQNSTTGAEDDINSKKSRDYAKMRDHAVSRLRPTLIGAVKAGPASITLHRR